MATLKELLAKCGLEDYEKTIVDAGFTKVSDLVELVSDWETKPENKELFNTLCHKQLDLNGMKRLKLLNALKGAKAPAEEEDQKEATTAGGDGEAAGGAIDLAFLLDTTGSMGSYISSAQKNIRDIVKKVKEDEDVTDVRFALVSYKDYNQGDTTKLVSRHGQEQQETPGADEEEEPGMVSNPGLLARLGSLFGSSTPEPKKKRKKGGKKTPSRMYGAYGGRGGGNGFPDGTAARIYDFTADISTMQAFVDEQRATGGGDGPEAVATALDCCENLSWREGAAKIAILIADAPPHGIEPSGDNFPDGDPIERDALAIARALADKDITMYTVACEPSVTNSWSFCRDFMEGVAEIGGGMLVPLSNAQMLTDMVLASCKEGADLEKIQKEVEKELKTLKKQNPNADQEQLAEMCSANLASRGTRTYQTVESSNAYANFDKSNVRRYASKGMTLRSAKQKNRASKAPKNWDRGMATQRISSQKGMISTDQCSRMMRKKARTWNFG